MIEFKQISSDGATGLYAIDDSGQLWWMSWSNAIVRWVKIQHPAGTEKSVPFEVIP